MFRPLRHLPRYSYFLGRYSKKEKVLIGVYFRAVFPQNAVAGTFQLLITTYNVVRRRWRTRHLMEAGSALEYRPALFHGLVSLRRGFTFALVFLAHRAARPGLLLCWRLHRLHHFNARISYFFSRCLFSATWKLISLSAIPEDFSCFLSKNSQSFPKCSIKRPMTFWKGACACVHARNCQKNGVDW